MVVRNAPGPPPILVGGTDGTDVIGQGIPFAYDDTLAVTVEGEAADISVTLDTGAVSAGEIWVVTQVSARDVERQPTHLEVAVLVGGSTVVDAGSFDKGVSSWLVSGAVKLVLKENDKLRGILHGVQSGDTCTFNVHGYKIKV